jgi:hypothetical protein
MGSKPPRRSDEGVDFERYDRVNDERVVVRFTDFPEDFIFTKSIADEIILETNILDPAKLNVEKFKKEVRPRYRLIKGTSYILVSAYDLATSFQIRLTQQNVTNRSEKARSPKSRQAPRKGHRQHGEKA